MKFLGNKELELWVQLQGYDFTEVTETWWDGLHDWSAAMALEEGHIQMVGNESYPLCGTAVRMWEVLPSNT